MAAPSATWDLLATFLSQERILNPSRLKNQTPNSQVKEKSRVDGWDRHVQAPEACVSTQTRTQGAPSSLTRLRSWRPGGSRLRFPEESPDPDLCGTETASIPGLNVLKRVKLTFRHCSRQGSCRLWLPRNPAELALGGAPSPKAGWAHGSRQKPSVSQLRLSAWQTSREVAGVPPADACRPRGGTSASTARSLCLKSRLFLFPHVLARKCQAPASENLRFLSLTFTVWSTF